MAPPIARGRELVTRRLGGVVFLAVLAGLLGLSVALYQKAFTDTVTVVLEADRAGNQLSAGGDVKARGVLVGRIEQVSATPDGARLRLALDPAQAARIPAGTRALLLPKTLFGEKYVALSFPGGGSGPGGGGLTDGAVIEQDRTATAVELSTALDRLLPLLQTLRPEQLSVTLNAVSTALRGRGERLGGNLVLARDYLAELNPELPRLQADLAGTADFADTVYAATDDLVAFLDDISAVNRNLVRDQGPLDQVLRQTTAVAGTAQRFTADNEQRFITLARESRPNLELYAKYAPEYPCMAYSLVEDQRVIANAFGTLQPGLHITLEVVRDNGSYVPGDEPEYLDEIGPTCRSLGAGPRERPIPEYRDAEDGYRDGQGIVPETGQRTGEPPEGPSGPYTYPDQRRKAPQDQGNSDAAASSTALDRAAVGAALAPAFGASPREVPDVALLLFAPVARGTVVTVG